ncbi:MAG TPA: queuosine precursor transporter [Spirochaetia bacterium]|nr:queuosine precursor transporter [Spirochaetia bacterium]
MRKKQVFSAVPNRASPGQERPGGYRWLDFITAAFVGVLIISNIASTKILDLGLFTFDGGTILFPVAYIFGDVLTEVYGYRRSRRVIWTGFFWLFVAAAVFAAVDVLPSARGWNLQKSFHAILGQTPRIVAASLVAYFAGEFSNSYTLARMKIWTQGRWLWTRTVGSTLIGEAVDTCLFLSIAFLGVLPFPLLLSVFVSNYVFKVGVEVLFTPVTYRIVAFLKRIEMVDYFDYGTNFNPFSAGERVR